METYPVPLEQGMRPGYLPFRQNKEHAVLAPSLLRPARLVPDGDFWLSVQECTAQPMVMV